MKAIILAAGRGSRLHNGTDAPPKCMISIGKKTIIQYQIEQCLKQNIENFVIVVGYRKEELIEHVLCFINADQVEFIENPIYATTNTLYSLWLAREHFTEDFVYFNADVVFQDTLLAKITGASESSLLLVEEKLCGEEEVKVIVDRENRILTIGKLIDINKAKGEFIGVGRFSFQVLKEFAEILTIAVNEGKGNQYFEYAVDLLAKNNLLIAVSTEGIPCIEIDFPNDLEKAKRMFSL